MIEPIDFKAEFDRLARLIETRLPEPTPFIDPGDRRPMTPFINPGDRSESEMYEPPARDGFDGTQLPAEPMAEAAERLGDARTIRRWQRIGKIVKLGMEHSPDQRTGIAAIKAPELLDAIAVAAMLDVSERHVQQMGTSGRDRFPKPIKIGRSTKWRRADVLKWVASRKPC